MSIDLSDLRNLLVFEELRIVEALWGLDGEGQPSFRTCSQLCTRLMGPARKSRFRKNSQFALAAE